MRRKKNRSSFRPATTIIIPTAYMQDPTGASTVGTTQGPMTTMLWAVTTLSFNLSLSKSRTHGQPNRTASKHEPKDTIYLGIILGVFGDYMGDILGLLIGIMEKKMKTTTMGSSGSPNP